MCSAAGWVQALRGLQLESDGEGGMERWRCISPSVCWRTNPPHIRKALIQRSEEFGAGVAFLNSTTVNTMGCPEQKAILQLHQTKGLWFTACHRRDDGRGWFRHAEEKEHPEYREDGEITEMTAGRMLLLLPFSCWTFTHFAPYWTSARWTYLGLECAVQIWAVSGMQ